MRARILRPLLGLLALAFAASGVAAHYCNAAHHSGGGANAPVAVDASHHAHDGADAHKHHVQQAQHGADHHHAVQDSEPAAIDDISCSKCCGICTLVTAVAPPAAGQAVFKVSAAEFAVRTSRHSGASLRVDPGIPKRIS